jgi:polyhydroxyalkanoate depolymerase
MEYHVWQAQADLMAHLRLYTEATAQAMRQPWLAGLPAARRIAAACAVFASAQVTHSRPSFGIGRTMLGSGAAAREVLVHEEAVHVLPFCTLLRFAKEDADDVLERQPQPRVLLVAPMSGHFATLLRDTVRTMLPEHDVYITDWHNARDVPLSAGAFGLDQYTRYLIEFLGVLGEGAHMLAVCQPCVAALAAVALMSEDGHPATPASLTLMAGPIDCRISPTEVNKLATTRPIEWFEKNLISHVPWRHRGGGRRVYPGFVQLSAFMSMNRERHVNAFRDYYAHLVADEFDKAEITRTFYEEYMAVADLSADFYLETVRLVFQDHALPSGELMVGSRHVDPAAIRRTALLTIEGERDDICSVGQTLAAQDLCSTLRPYLRTHYVQAGVGHYGVFSGKRWQNQIYPIVRDVIHVSQ